MFNFLRKRKVTRLARKALAVAAADYASGAFGWTVSYEFKDGEVYHDTIRLDRPEIREVVERNGDQKHYGDLYADPRKIYEAATGGCLLGGLARAAWIVCGSPEFNTSAWDLKLDVELEADRLVLISMGIENPSDLDYQVERSAEGGGRIPQRNDRSFDGKNDAVDILRKALEV